MNEFEDIQGIDIYFLDQILKGRISKSDKILDAGCGSGRNIHLLLNKGYDVYGFDQNKEVIDLLKENYKTLEKRFEISSVSDYKSPFKFDFIICNAVLHFAYGHDHFDKMISNLSKLLARDGILFIRMTSNIGLEHVLVHNNSGIYVLPDESTRYLITRDKIDSMIETHKLKLLEPVKTVFVDGLRSMTTLIMSK